MIIPRTPTPSLEADETVSVDGSSRNSGNLPISREARLANLKVRNQTTLSVTANVTAIDVLLNFIHIMRL